ncbi:MAG TPA: aspartate--tRNA ligase [Candidatus Pacearchaeota archaeon]|nr:aspartate--tRNA ligase [Candidatus Pacearchaeota archaeon]
MKRTLNIETVKKIGEEVLLKGWVNSIRAHGKIIFIDLRDSSGVTQVVFTPKMNEAAYNLVKDEIKPEYVVEILGEVNERPENMKNIEIPTGSIEIKAKDIKILSKAKTMPFPIDTDGYDINEKTRLEYRYIDLRRERLKRNLKKRFEVISLMRAILKEKDFIEIETPILTKSTPEGARDFVVPSRNFKGKFYALPQSPQQYKQLLISAGYEKYFQIARCLRDEDPRGDRQPEFTQLDLEMAFPESKEEIMDLMEEIYIKIVETLFPEKHITQIPFPRMTYKEAMEKYGSDKPDMRRDKNDENELAFWYITDFPMFDWKEEYGCWGACHHPFTLPQEKDLEKIKNNPENILAHQFDLVLNGFEIAGGSLRTHDIELLKTCFLVMGNNEEDIKKQFKHYFDAFEYGIPPHGGMASGIDRFFAVVLNEESIREVIAFPKTGDNKDLMMDAPAPISESQLKELGIKIKNEE